MIVVFTSFAYAELSSSSVNWASQGWVSNNFCPSDQCTGGGGGGSNDSLWLNVSGETISVQSFVKVENFTAGYYKSNGSLGFNITDENDNLLLNTNVEGANYFSIGTSGLSSFIRLYDNPNPSNDYLLAKFTNTQGQSTTDINFYESGTGHNRIWDSGSMRLGGPEGSDCDELTEMVDCDTSTTGSDLVINDSIWTGGGFFFANGKFNMTRGGIASIRHKWFFHEGGGILGFGDGGQGTADGEILYDTSVTSVVFKRGASPAAKIDNWWFQDANVTIDEEVRGSKHVFYFSADTIFLNNFGNTVFFKLGEVQTTQKIGASTVRPGSLTGVSVHSSLVNTTGFGASASIQAAINGTAVLSVPISVVPHNSSTKFKYQKRDDDQFKEGQIISVAMSGSALGLWSLYYEDLTVGVEVYYDE